MTKQQEFEKIHREMQQDFQEMTKAYSRFMMRTNARLQELRELVEDE